MRTGSYFLVQLVAILISYILLVFFNGSCVFFSPCHWCRKTHIFDGLHAQCEENLAGLIIDVGAREEPFEDETAAIGNYVTHLLHAACQGPKSGSCFNLFHVPVCRTTFSILQGKKQIAR